MKPHAGNCSHVAYRVTCDEFAALLKDAAGCCQLCGAPSAELLLDHDHNVGQWAVRGLVCRRCNLDLSAVDDGRREPCARTRRFLDEAWHRARPMPPELAARRLNYQIEGFRAGAGFDGMEFVGGSEIAHGLGVSRQRVAQLISRADFPLPYMHLAIGKVWLAVDIEAWDAKRKRGGGRRHEGDAPLAPTRSTLPSDRG